MIIHTESNLLMLNKFLPLKKEGRASDSAAKGC